MIYSKHDLMMTYRRKFEDGIITSNEIIESLVYLWGCDTDKEEFDELFWLKGYVTIPTLSKVVTILYKKNIILSKFPIDGRLYKKIKGKIKGKLCGLTLALKKRISKYVCQLTKESLEFQSVYFKDFKVWKNIIDLCHINEKRLKDKLFVKFVYGNKVPELLDTLNKTSAHNLSYELFNKFENLHNYYSALRIRYDYKKMPADFKMCMIRKASLEDIFWYWEEILYGLNTEIVESVIYDRLNSGEEINSKNRYIDKNLRSGYGKILQQILYFDENKKSKIVEILVERANNILNDNKALLNSLKIAILADASYSMDIAVKTATIVSSFLGAVLSAELSFFNHDLISSPILSPKTVSDVFKILKHIYAKGYTAPAAALYPYLAMKQTIDLFLVVTDEEENTKYAGKKFSEMFLEYKNTVNQFAKVFFISFIDGKEGQMVKELRGMGIEVEYYKFHRKKPDLSKIDMLLGKINDIFY
jgi:hypothetical protein